MLDRDKVEQCLKYDPSTGSLIWKVGRLKGKTAGAITDGGI